ncbi:aldehyde ferredoxin oxidoreductase family protein [Spirochaetota bacterium]
MSKTYGWTGKILKVDLTSSQITEEPLPKDYMENYIGGAGINARLLYDLLKDNPHADPLSPENPLIFGAGPVVGTSFPCSSRFTVTAKSPLTGIFGDSNAGGWFPTRMKQAGYDHIIIQGKSDKPVALVIDGEGKNEIVDAGDLWGLDTYETDSVIMEKHGKCENARIGTAGENLVTYANILSGSKRISTNGRTGMGCVMGSKKLKAIIIKVADNKKVDVADKDAVDEMCKRYKDLWNNAIWMEVKKDYGTLTNFAQIAEYIHVKNEQEPLTKEQLDSYDLDIFTEEFKSGQSTCYGCPVSCTQKWEIKEGPYAGEKGDKVEYGHLLNLGPHIGVFDFAAMLHLSHISNRLGMDCIQFGYNAATIMECFQRGILNSKKTGGIEINWGDVEVVEKIMHLTAKREGFGDILAKGAREMANDLGKEAVEYCTHTKGMSFPYSTSSALPMSLASSVATRGGDHLKGHPFSSIIGHEEMLGKMFKKDIPAEAADHMSPVAKGRVVWWQENYKMILDCLGVCFLPIINSNVWSDPLVMVEEMGEWYQTITGLDSSKLFESAERAYQVERCFNARLGLSRDDDIRKGTLRGGKDPVELPGMLDEYYEYRGCSPDGLPTRKRLEEIGLGDIAEDLNKQNKLSDEKLPAVEELVK